MERKLSIVIPLISYSIVILKSASLRLKFKLSNDDFVSSTPSDFEDATDQTKNSTQKTSLIGERAYLTPHQLPIQLTLDKSRTLQWFRSITCLHEDDK